MFYFQRLLKICIGLTDAEVCNISLKRLLKNHSVSCTFLPWKFYLSQGHNVPTNESRTIPFCFCVPLSLCDIDLFALNEKDVHGILLNRKKKKKHAKECNTYWVAGSKILGQTALVQILKSCVTLAQSVNLSVPLFSHPAINSQACCED